ncbi:MAG: hypothetical protein H8E46_08120 [FCB group bacterium]|nr:hypothetical protein [FCB group bacterium]
MDSVENILNKITGFASGSIEFDYDEIGDVLYSQVKNIYQNIDIDLDGGVVINIDPKSYQINGFIIIDYKKRLRDRKIGKIPFFSSNNLPMI